MDPGDLTIRALVTAPHDGSTKREIRELEAQDLGDGELLIAVEYSSVNYKDALAASADGKVARIQPLIPGIDLSGTVLQSTSEAFEVGDRILAHGYGLGVSHHGGFTTHARIPASWALPLPDGLTSRAAMILGTAGFTAGLSVDVLERHGVTPAAGSILVTGASGGVGSTAVAILARRGFEVVASTGSDQHDWLRSLGASRIVARDDVSDRSGKALGRQLWAGVVDCVGGAPLSAALSCVQYGGAVAASGLTAGSQLPTTVLPFILRGIALLGIDSVQLDMTERRAIWDRLAGDLRPDTLDRLTTEVPLDGVSAVLDAMLSGGSRGRTLVSCV